MNNNTAEQVKMTFREFIAFMEDEEKPHEWKEWAEGLPVKLAKENKHGGDCTGMPGTCLLCCLQYLLESYYEYRFGKEETPSPSTEAIAFAQWLGENYDMTSSSQRPWQRQSMHYTTSELYDLFKQKTHTP